MCLAASILKPMTPCNVARSVSECACSAEAKMAHNVDKALKEGRQSLADVCPAVIAVPGKAVLSRSADHLPTRLMQSTQPAYRSERFRS